MGGRSVRATIQDGAVSDLFAERLALSCHGPRVPTPPAPAPPSLPPTPTPLPPAPPPQVVEPAQAATVTLRFSVKPARATITVDGKVVKGGELVVPRDDAKHTVTIEAAGFKPVTEELAFDESQRLASRVQRSVVGRLSGQYKEIKDLGTKEALFYVLLGAKMPAILVEASFLSHPEEEKRLATKAYQEHVAQAVAQGIEAFLADRQRVAQVD